MALDQDIGRLAQIPLFAILEPEALRLLAFSGETRMAVAGTVLFRRGDASDGGLLVTSGSVLVIDGSYAAVQFGPGMLIGETELLRDVPYGSSAVAQETSTLFALPRRAVLRVLEEHPVSAKRLLAFLARRLNTSLNVSDGL